MNTRSRRLAGATTLLAAMLLSGHVHAKPIAFNDGTTVMAEYGAGTMNELQLFHAPRYFYSVGGGYLELKSDTDERTRYITYARLNYLLKRWNREAAQGNVFAWGGVGSGRTGESDEREATWNTGLQLDYETRRVYASLKTDLFDSSAFTNRIDTLQLGLAPYQHDYDDLATWFVIQGRRITGEIHEGTEWSLLLRLFKGGAWIEAGATTDGKLQAMAMFNF
jgi:hypothetical protein